MRAHHVVLAGNIHLAELMPQFGNTLLPAHSYVIVTAPLGDALHEAMRFPGAVSDTDRADNHYCVVEGDRLMWSGRNTVWRGKPQDYVATLTSQIKRTFPQLRDVRAEYAWTGSIGSTVHRMPQIGEITPGLWLLERLRLARAQHHRDGRRDRGARHRRRRQDLADLRAVRAGLVRRRVWPRGAAGRLLVEPHVRAVRQPTGPAAARVGGCARWRARTPAAAASRLLPLLPSAGRDGPSRERFRQRENPPVIAAEDAPEILLQPAPAVERAIAGRPREEEARGRSDRRGAAGGGA